VSAEPFLSLQCPRCGGSGVVTATTMGQRLKALRIQAKLTQSELSVKIGGLISEKNIGAVEQGSNLNPPLQAMMAIAKVLGVTLDYLCDDEPADPLA
jgi:transcriptional regulator with XRE-family HTH domain